jgi:hypothetical protein
MVDEELKNLLRNLSSQHEKLIEMFSKNSESNEKGKDLWDKISTLSTFLSSVLIAGMGLYFTHVYNTTQNEREINVKNQQNRIAEVQTLEKFMPHLLGSEESKKVAILAISSLGNTELATRLANLYPSGGTVSAVATIASSGTDTERLVANKVLDNMFAKYRPAVVQLRGKDGCILSGTVINRDGYVVTANYATDCLKKDSDTITTWDKKTYHATETAASKELGLAVYKIEGSNFLALKLAEKPTMVGDEVLAIGSTGTELAAPATGKISKVDQKFVTAVFNREMAGSGGGPVLNPRGEVIGIVYQGAQLQGTKKNVEECIRSDIIKSFLNSHGIQL